ncbi:MAG: hypothetical protein WCJ56_13310 [bacterium]
MSENPTPATRPVHTVYWLVITSLLLVVVVGAVVLLKGNFLSRKPVATAPAKQKTWSSGSEDMYERICYVDSFGDVPILCTMTLSGKDRRKVTELPEFYYGPFISRDRQFVVTQDGPGNTTVRNIAQQTNTVLKKGPSADDSRILLGISPDGTKLLFVNNRGIDEKTYTLEMVQVTDGAVTQIASGNIFDNQKTEPFTSLAQSEGAGYSLVWPAFTPDGGSILYGDKDGNLMRYQLASGKASVITTVGKYALPPVFDAAGKNAVICDGMRLLVISLGDFKVRVLPITVPKESQISAVAYNGKRIAYLLETDDYEAKIHTKDFRSINPDGTGDSLLAKMDADHRYSSLGLNQEDSYLTYINNDHEKSDQLMICKLELGTAKTDTVGPGENPVWAMSDAIFGESIKDEPTDQVGLPATYRVRKTINADFDGDGKDETAYYAIAPTLREFAVWMVKDNAVSWSMPAEETKRKYLPKKVQGIKALDINGDGRPELCLLAAESMEEFWYFFWAYSWQKGEMRNIASAFEIPATTIPYIKFGATGTPATLACESRKVGGYELLLTYTWDGTSFSAGDIITLGKVDYEEAENMITELQYKTVDEVLE